MDAGADLAMGVPKISCPPMVGVGVAVEAGMLGVGSAGVLLEEGVILAVLDSGKEFDDIGISVVEACEAEQLVLAGRGVEGAGSTVAAVVPGVVVTERVI